MFIKPGNMVINSPACAYKFKIPALALVIARQDILIQVTSKQSLDIKAIGWNLTNYDALYCSRCYNSISNLEQYCGRVAWFMKKDLMLMSIHVILPDNSTHTMSVEPELDSEIIINNKKYIISEISEDKTTAWVE